MFGDIREIVSKTPAALVIATAGGGQSHVPPIISKIQILLTDDTMQYGQSILDWVKGDDNKLLEQCEQLLNVIREGQKIAIEMEKQAVKT